jgi:hypothetical protein
METVLAESSLIFIGAPHAAYAKLAIPESTKLVDIWNRVERLPS